MTVDLLQVSTDEPGLERIFGTDGVGSRGVPVCGGFDVDGDGFNDYAVGYFTADPVGRENAGIVNLIFGTGTIQGELDSGIAQSRNLIIWGDLDPEGASSSQGEASGSEVWMDDVTGDGLGDLIICRQNFTPATGREGAGALSVIVGGPEVRAYADTLAPYDLRNPPPSVTQFDVWGVAQFDRLGIWARTADVDGDGIADIIVGADQEDDPAPNAGGVWVVRGGGYLAAPITLDLATFGGPVMRAEGVRSVDPLAGNVAHIIPPSGFPTLSSGAHLGGTLLGADMDGNGRAEVLAAAALNRAGAGLRHPHPNASANSQASGGETDGTLYIIWDDNFPEAPWPHGYVIDLDGPTSGATTRINGDSAIHNSFGEEIAAGLDFDNNGVTDLFVGDLVGDGTGGSRITSGVGIVFYDASLLKNTDFDLNNPATIPPGVTLSTILGPTPGAIGSDTISFGDFNNDGRDDLAIGNPNDDPFGRSSAGTIHVLFGQDTKWPALIDTAPGALPPPADVKITLIVGAEGSGGANGIGDTLCYSAAYGDIDEDGYTDIITNEMVGDAPTINDVGNLLLISGRLISPPLPEADYIILD